MYDLFAPPPLMRRHFATALISGAGQLFEGNIVFTTPGQLHGTGDSGQQADFGQLYLDCLLLRDTRSSWPEPEVPDTCWHWSGGR